METTCVICEAIEGLSETPDFVGPAIYLAGVGHAAQGPDVVGSRVSQMCEKHHAVVAYGLLSLLKSSEGPTVVKCAPKTEPAS